MSIAAQRVEGKVVKKLSELAGQYFLVASCWNNYKLAVRHKMSFEKAVKILRSTRDEALLHRRKGRMLAQKCLSLLQDIVEKSEVNPEHEKAMS